MKEYKNNEQLIEYLVSKNVIIQNSDDKFLWKPNKYYDNNIISEYDRDLKLILNYDAELKNLCENNKIKYIPMRDTLEKSDFIDGLHPNHNGHKKIFEYIIENMDFWQ